MLEANDKNTCQLETERMPLKRKQYKEKNKCLKNVFSQCRINVFLAIFITVFQGFWDNNGYRNYRKYLLCKIATPIPVL